MTGLPDLHGWATAAVTARVLGVTPSTVRRRAAKGLVEAIRNPCGPGLLYRAEPPGRPSTHGSGGAAGETRENPPSDPIRGLRSDDGYALTVLPASATQVARHLGLSAGRASRTLHRLARAGLAERNGPAATGPRGGRPAIIWKAVR